VSVAVNVCTVKCTRPGSQAYPSLPSLLLLRPTFYCMLYVRS